MAADEPRRAQGVEALVGCAGAVMEGRFQGLRIAGRLGKRDQAAMEVVRERAIVVGDRASNSSKDSGCRTNR